MSEQLTNNEEAPKLYAGKFKTIEELEAGYNNSAKVYQENETLKKQLETTSKVPDQYMTPSDVSLDEHELQEIVELAKQSELSQAHFDKLARTAQHKKQLSSQKFEQARSAIDDAQFAVLEDYVKKHYPEKLHDEMIKKIVIDKDTRQAAIQHRERLLNSSTPGMMSRPPHTGYKVTKEDLLKAAKEADSARGADKIKLQQKHINLTKQYTEQQKHNQ